MSKQVISDAQVHWNGRNLSGNLNQVDLMGEAATEDVTNFASGGWRELVAAIAKGAASFAGFLENAAQPDQAFFEASEDAPLVVTKSSPGAIGDVAYFLDTTKVTYEPGMAVGSAYRMNLGFEGGSPMIRGVLLGNGTDDATGGNQTAHQFGSTPALGNTIYAALQVPAIDTGTCDVVIESDDNAGFTTATTRFTFTQVTAAAASQILTLAGPVTDDYWRARVTLGGGATVDFNVFMGWV